MRLSDYLRKAWSAIDHEDKWIKGDEYVPADSRDEKEVDGFCMIGAASYSVWNDAHGLSSNDERDEVFGKMQVFGKMRHLLLSSIDGNHPIYEGGYVSSWSEWENVEAWNDDEDREWWEVRDVFERAIKMAEEAERATQRVQVQESDLAASGD